MGSKVVKRVYSDAVSRRMVVYPLPNQLCLAISRLGAVYVISASTYKGMHDTYFAALDLPTMRAVLDYLDQLEGDL